MGLAEKMARQGRHLRGGLAEKNAPARATLMVVMTNTAKPKWSNTLVALMGKNFDRRVPGHVKVGTHIRSIRTLHTCLSFLCFIPSFPTLSHILFQAGAFMRRIIFPSDARRCCVAEQSGAVARTRQNRVYARPTLGPTHASWQLKNPTLPLQ